MAKKLLIDTHTLHGITPECCTTPAVALGPRRLCETRRGDLAFSLGRLRFQRGSPMLVEHLGGLYLEHALCGRVITGGYGDEFDIMHMFGDDGY